MGHPLGPVWSELSFTFTALGAFPPQRVLLPLWACMVGTVHGGDPVWWGPCVVGTLRGGDPCGGEPAWWGPAWWGPCVMGTLRGGDLRGGDPVRLPGLLPAQLHLSVSVSEGLSLILCLSLSFCLCLILRLQVLGADCPCPRGVISAHLEDPLRQFKTEEKSFHGFLRASCCPV